MPGPAITIADRIDVKVAALDAEILRLQANAAAEVARLRATRRLLLDAKLELTPAREALLVQLKAEGLL